MDIKMIEKCAEAMLIKMKTEGLCITKINSKPAYNYTNVVKAIIKTLRQPSQEVINAVSMTQRDVENYQRVIDTIYDGVELSNG